MIYSDEFATKITQRQILYFQSRGCVGNCDWLRTNCWRDSTAACSKVGFLLTAFSNLGKLLLWENQKNSTRMGFEPTRAEHIGLAVQRLNHSATLSSWSQLSPHTHTHTEEWCPTSWRSKCEFQRFIYSLTCEQMVRAEKTRHIFQKRFGTLETWIFKSLLSPVTFLSAASFWSCSPQ